MGRACACAGGHHSRFSAASAILFYLGVCEHWRSSAFSPGFVCERSGDRLAISCVADSGVFLWVPSLCILTYLYPAVFVYGWIAFLQTHVFAVGYRTQGKERKRANAYCGSTRRRRRNSTKYFAVAKEQISSSRVCGYKCFSGGRHYTWNTSAWGNQRHRANCAGT